MKYEEIPLVNNEAIHNFELTVEGYRAFIDYKKKDDKIYLIHTEVPVELEQWFLANGHTYRTIVLDCLTLWLSNLREHGVPDEQIPEFVHALLRAMRTSRARVVVVTNELGLGLIPMEGSARGFRDLAGKANQLCAGEADEVYFIVSGMSIQMKPDQHVNRARIIR